MRCAKSRVFTMSVWAASNKCTLSRALALTAACGTFLIACTVCLVTTYNARKQVEESDKEQ